MIHLSAPWLVTGAGEVFAKGALLVGDDGRIVQVGPGPAVRAPRGTTRRTFPGGILLPGLVNAHSHLELTGLDEGAPAEDFPAWIRRLIERKAARTAGDFLAAARQGVKDSLAAGITTTADTGDSGAVIQAMDEAGLGGIAFLEVFGPHPDEVESHLAAFQERLRSLVPFASGRARLGVSPHAPYSVSGPLYRAVTDWARGRGIPIAVHVAESSAEWELVMEARGPFAEQWKRRGIPLPLLPGRTPLAWLEEHGVLGPETLCIHAVRATAEDVARLQLYGAAVAHCPRSNRRHGHGEAPLRAFLDGGVRVGLGTDSVVSVAPMDLLAEARAARDLAGLDAAAAFRLATLGAARALGMGRAVGSLEAGKFGDVVAVRGRAGTPAEAVEAALAAGPGDVLATLVGGREAWTAA